MAEPGSQARRGRNGRRADDLRDHRRPGEEDDLPGALPAGGAGQARVPDRRRRARRLERRASCASTPAKRSPTTVEDPDEDVFARLAARSPTSRATTPTPPPSSGSARRSARRSGRSSTSRCRPSLFATVVRGLGEAGLTENARVVIEKPFGHDLESARALNAELHEVLAEDQIMRIDHFLGKEPVMDITYLRFANSLLEPVWNRQHVAHRADDDGGGLRRGGPRPLLRPGRGAARRGPEPHPPGARPGRDGAAGRQPPRLDPRQEAGAVQGGAQRRPGALRARPVRRLPGRAGGGEGLDHRDLRRAGAGDRQLALERSAVLHPGRQGDAGEGDRGERRLQAPAAAGGGPGQGARGRTR